MVKNPKKLPFTQLMVSIMPKKPGIYTFWDQSGKIIYIGQADKPNSLYAELKRHFDNEHYIHVDGIYDFQVEVCNEPEKQQVKFLEDHQKIHGCLPEFNEESTVPNIKGD